MFILKGKSDYYTVKLTYAFEATTALSLPGDNYLPRQDPVLEVICYLLH